MLGSPNAADTTAYIHDSTVTSAGGLTVSATSTEAISATVTNAATAAVEPSAGSSSYSASAVLTDNQILTASPPIRQFDGGSDERSRKATDAVTVKAANSASITASSSITALGTQAAAGPANDYANLASASYKYTNLSGTEDLNFGDQVAVEQTNGTIIVYRFMGDSDEGKGVDLGALTGATASMAYTNLEYWKPLSADQLKEEAKAQSANPKSGASTSETVTQNSAFSSASLYLLFDYNNVQSSTESYVSNSTVTGGSVAVNSTDSATISATDSSTVTTATGATGAGGMVTTNHVLGSAEAYIEGATVTAKTGQASVDAENTSAITATNSTALTADGNAVSLMAAFNVIGWSDDNFGSLALAALIGTDQLLGAQTPDQTLAYISGASTVTAATDVLVTANGSATITASVANQASAGNGDATATVSVGGVLATNKINTATEAYIGTSPGDVATAASLDTSSVTATGGTVAVSATDKPTLSASSSITISAQASTGGVASALSGDYLYTDKSGVQTVKKGDQVYVNGTVYTYLGNGDPAPAKRGSRQRRPDLRADADRLHRHDPMASRRRRVGFDRRLQRRVEGGWRGVRAQRRPGLRRRRDQRGAERGDVRVRHDHRRNGDQRQSQ